MKGQKGKFFAIDSTYFEIIDLQIQENLEKGDYIQKKNGSNHLFIIKDNGSHKLKFEILSIRKISKEQKSLIYRIEKEINKKASR